MKILMPNSCNHSYLSYLVLTGKDVVALATFTGRGGPAWCTSVETTAGGGLGWDACPNLSLEAYEDCCIFCYSLLHLPNKLCGFMIWWLDVGLFYLCRGFGLRTMTADDPSVRHPSRAWACKKRFSSHNADVLAGR